MFHVSHTGTSETEPSRLWLSFRSWIVTQLLSSCTTTALLRSTQHCPNSHPVFAWCPSAPDLCVHPLFAKYLSSSKTSASWCYGFLPLLIIGKKQSKKKNPQNMLDLNRSPSPHCRCRTRKHQRASRCSEPCLFAFVFNQKSQTLNINLWDWGELQTVWVWFPVPISDHDQQHPVTPATGR